MLSPFRGFRDLQSEMDRMMGEAFGRLPQRAGHAERAEWAPAIDAVTEAGNLVIRAELPGMKPEDVEVSFHEGVLTISGEHRQEEEKQDTRYLIRERRYGSFRRSMALPQGVDEGRIRASFNEGVLEVTVEGGASEVEQQPRRIEIER